MRKVKKGTAASRHNRELVNHDIEDISEAKKATFEELVSLYDGASAAAYAWNGAITQPRSGEDLVAEIMAAQYDRCFQLMQGVAAEL